MTKYYLLENGIITQSADFRFDENCLETQEEIVRDELSGQLYLQSDYDTYIQTAEYIKEQRLKEIEIELNQADLDYDAVLNTPVEYSNGHTYKPIYINDYVLLIASGLSYEIWSDDEIYSETMDTAALSTLCLFLKSIAEPAYQKRKVDRKILLEERKSLSI